MAELCIICQTTCADERSLMEHYMQQHKCIPSTYNDAQKMLMLQLQLQLAQEKTKQLQIEKDHELRMQERELAHQEEMQAAENQRRRDDHKMEMIRTYMKPKVTERTTVKEGWFSTTRTTDRSETVPDIASVLEKFNNGGRLALTQ